jgi:hypothetical protein
VRFGYSVNDPRAGNVRLRLIVIIFGFCLWLVRGVPVSLAEGWFQDPVSRNGVSLPQQLSDPVQAELGLKIERSNNNNPNIVWVGENSEASRAGLQAGDQVCDAKVSGNQITITVERNGMRSSTTLKLAQPINSRIPEGQGTTEQSAGREASAGDVIRPFKLAAEAIGSSDRLSTRIARPGQGIDSAANKQPYALSANANVANASSSALVDPLAFQPGFGQFGRSGNPPFDLHAQGLGAGAEHQNMPILDVPTSVRLLANYQIELIVDRSLSMRRQDCPGELSRWAWCGMQAKDLSTAIAPYVPNGLTIIPFASRYDVYQGASAQNVADLFDHPNFEFGTRLAEPLTDRLNHFFAEHSGNGKPLLIAVITDGVPFPPPEPKMVEDELVGASRMMKAPGEVTVVFLQIGGRDRFGHDYLQSLDQNLVQNGARFHYVHTIPFEHLTVVGLPAALAQVVRDGAINK